MQQGGATTAASGVEVGRVRARETGGVRRRGEPVSTGVPLPKGRVRAPERLALVDGQGRRIPVQTQVLDRWPDESVRWLLLDFALDLDARADTVLSLRDGMPANPDSVQARGSQPTVEVRFPDESVFVDTGPVQFALEPGTVLPFRSVRAGGVELLERGGGLRCRDAEDRVWVGTVDSVAVEVAGPLRATVRLDGAFRHGTDTPPLQLQMRAHFFAGCATRRPG